MEKVVQNYVVVKNLRKAPGMFSDHQQSQRVLEPFGSKADSVKILLADENVVGQMRHYDTLRKAGDFQVVFSSGLDGTSIPDSANKTTVHSTADVDSKASALLAKLREDQAVKSRSENNAAARLAHAKADAVARGAKPERKAAEAGEPAKALVPEDKGTEITPEYLAGLGRAELYEIAAKMKLQVRAGASKGGIAKAILLNLK